MKGIGLKELAFVGHPVTEKARKVYGDTLGLKETITFEEGGEVGWLEYDLAGETLALANASEQWSRIRREVAHAWRWQTWIRL
jgi:hypothetical protein